MITQMLIGAVLIAVTVLIHAVALDRLMKILSHTRNAIFRMFKLNWRMVTLIFTVLCVFCSHIVQIWLWAFFYLSVDAFSNLEEALYYSTSTFTTVGYGDILLPQDWRLLGAFQSANGFMVFGWSTAFIFEVMSKLYQRDNIS